MFDSHPFTLTSHLIGGGGCDFYRPLHWSAVLMGVAKFPHCCWGKCSRNVTVDDRRRLSCCQGKFYLKLAKFVMFGDMCVCMCMCSILVLLLWKSLNESECQVVNHSLHARSAWVCHECNTFFYSTATWNHVSVFKLVLYKQYPSWVLLFQRFLCVTVSFLIEY